MITIAFGMIGIVALGSGFCIMNLNGRIEKLEKEIKTIKQVKKLGDMELPSVQQYVDQIQEQVEAQYNQSYGDPIYTEWIDKDFDSKGVK